MDHTDALIFLGLDAATDPTAVEAAASAKAEQLQARLDSAPTDALKSKYQQMLDEVEAAKAALLASSAPPPPPSGLSQTMMADLPGAAPSYTQGPGGGASTGAVGLQAGQVLMDRYEVREQIGVGGMGAVYRAYDQMRSEEIALKVMLPHLVSSEKARERFFAEAKISSSLSHPNIVNVFDVQTDGVHTFLTMELLEGQTLRQIMSARKAARQQFTVEQVQRYLGPLCDALTYAHEFTVHRDIKPENVFLTEDGKIKLMDFGIARLMSASQMTETAAVMGTAYYMAPEALEGAKKLDGRADQYALGVMAYELLSGKIPAGMIAPLKQVWKDVSTKLAAAVQQALGPSPEDRFASMAAFKAALLGSSGGSRSFAASPVALKAIATGVVLAALGWGGKAAMDGRAAAQAEEAALQVAIADSMALALADSVSEANFGWTVAADRFELGQDQFAEIEEGRFRMGNPSAVGGHEIPVHEVRITQPFWLGKTEVTQAQWLLVMGTNPSEFKACGDDCPVERVSWNDIQEFLANLNEAVPGGGFRLPTEAEWEYAARAGTTGDYGGTGVLDQMGWYGENSGSETHPVAQKRPNAWGLYDMHGNVIEWVGDRYLFTYYGRSPASDPPGPASGSSRVLRGGSWSYGAVVARSSWRTQDAPADLYITYGFRLARAR